VIDPKARVRLDGAKATFRATMSRALAAGVVTGIDQADQEGRPLSQVQQIDLVTMACMAYHDAVVDAEDLLDGEAAIDQLVNRE
jgi:hypothetical protein